MDIEIREMTLEDVAEVLIIEKQSFTTPWSREALEMEIARNELARYIVATFNRKVVGYGGFWLIAGEGHITNIAIHKEYRGLGIGNLLMEGLIMIGRANNCEAMTLEVRKSNIVAQNLYKKYGFIEEGIRPNYYSDVGEDAIIMWKRMES